MNRNLLKGNYLMAAKKENQVQLFYKEREHNKKKIDRQEDER